MEQMTRMEKMEKWMPVEQFRLKLPVAMSHSLG